MPLAGILLSNKSSMQPICIQLFATAGAQNKTTREKGVFVYFTSGKYN